MKTVKFGLTYPHRPQDYLSGMGWDPDFPLECEELGYHSIYLSDHLDNRLECWTMLSAIGAITRRIRLGTMVLCNSIRYPALLASMAATLDVISIGRLELGIGAGWTRNDYDVCGIPYPKPNVRIAQLDESLQIIKKVWTEDKPSFEGRYYWMKQVHPRLIPPVQKPHPPILIAGGGEKLLLRVMAKHANICQPGFTFVGGTKKYSYHRTIQEFEHKMDVLRKHCEVVGRDFDEIEKMWWGDVIISKSQNELKKDVNYIRRRWPGLDLLTLKEIGIFGTPEECVERLLKYVEVGITYFLLSFRDLPNKKSLRLFADETIPHLS